jgi:predicted  nucleic acid-binding Zn-ribbon protein
VADSLADLVQLQDIDVLLREVKDPEMASQEERLGFPLENVETLERARRRLASRIDGKLLQTYERMSRRFARVVVPVEGTICAGCRMSLPTSAIRSRPSQTQEPQDIENCENCGRILYRR